MDKRYRLCDCDSEECSTPYWNRLYHDGHTCIHIDGSWHELEQKPLIRVRYKFHGDDETVTISVTEKQYNNLLDVSIIEKCDILGSADNPLTAEEKELFNQKILVACRQNSSHRKYLLR